MNKFFKSDLQELITEREQNCVSIYIPTHREITRSQQNAIMFKNLLARIQEDLTAAGLRSQDVKKLLEPAQELLGDLSFWRQQSDGLVLFISSRLFKHYRLPVKFDELVIISDGFHIKPLLPLLTEDNDFTVLALSLNKVRLFKCSRFDISEVELDDSPVSITEITKHYEHEKMLQHHTGAPRGRSERSGVFFGHGTGNEENDELIRQFFRQIDKGIPKTIRNERPPMILAGVEYLLSLFRESHTYPLLLDGKIEGNPENISADELHRQAWSIAQPYFLLKQRDLVEQYRQFAGTGKTSADIKEILSPANYGRTEFLFVALDVQLWGNIDSDNSLIELCREPGPGVCDLLNTAGVITILSGGSVFAVNSSEMPDHAPVAAIYRY